MTYIKVKRLALKNDEKGIRHGRKTEDLRNSIHAHSRF